MISVYIADDEVWITIGLKKLIQKSGLPFEVIGEAHNGVTTLEDIKTLKPDVLFTDISVCQGFPVWKSCPIFQNINLQPKSC